MASTSTSNPTDPSAGAEDSNAPTYESLIHLTRLFEAAETTTLLHQTRTFRPLYRARGQLTDRIPHFWALVFEQAPPEFDGFVQPSDSQVFAEALVGVEVERFEVPESGAAEGEGNPRSFELRMRFKANPWFSDEVLEKKFWYRRGLDGWAGLVSHPVRIHWKKGKDITNGLTDAAWALWEKRKGLHGTEAADGEKLQACKEYEELSKKLEENDPSAQSFFCLFGFVAERRYVTAEENEAAEKKVKEEMKRAEENGGDVPPPDHDEVKEEEEEERERREDKRRLLEQAVEICEQGDQIAMYISDDLYPSALKYFTAAQEDSSDLADEDISMLDSDEEGQEDDDDDEEGDVAIDIRALVGKGKASKRENVAGSDSPDGRAAKSARRE